MKLHLEIQLLLHIKHSAPSLHRPAGWLYALKWSVSFENYMKHKYSYTVRKMWSILMLIPVVHIVTMWQMVIY